VWRIEFDRRAFKDLERLGKTDRERVRKFLDRRVLAHDDPRTFGAPLAGALSGLWRYRVGDIRIIASIEDDRFVVKVVSVGNRRDIYR
jgi:mRNA interferase RelE/StbE